MSIQDLVGQYVDVCHSYGYVSGRLENDDGDRNYRISGTNGVIHFTSDDVSYIENDRIYLKGS